MARTVAAAAADPAWLARLLASNAGRAFRPPAGATLQALGEALLRYAQDHHPADAPLTDLEWLHMLRALYPGPPEAEAAEGRSGVVYPKGVYAKIDTGPAMDLLRELDGPPSARRSQAVDDVVAHGGRHIPVVLLKVSALKFAEGKLDDALFWFHAGLLRAMLDAKLCSDPSVSQTPMALIRKSPPDLAAAAFAFNPQTRRTVQEALAWDLRTPYDYDRRWIAMSGAGAARSGLDPAFAPPSVSLPQAQWAGVVERTRAHYAEIFSNAAAYRRATQASGPAVQ